MKRKMFAFITNFRLIRVRPLHVVKQDDKAISNFLGYFAERLNLAFS